MDLSLLTIQIAVLGLLTVACLSAIALRQLNFPYTVGLVIIGLILGFVGGGLPGIEAFANFQLSPNVILFLFLPPLIFESALTLDARWLLRNITPVLTLVTVGILLVTVIISSLMVWLTPLGWRESLLFGALISATDPVAVIALFNSLGVPKQLVILVEGESLLNDATAIVVFNLVLAGASMSPKELAIFGFDEFFRESLGGIFVGAILAWLISHLLVSVYRNFLIQGTLSAILAFGTFILAQHVLKVSGVIAVVSAGLVTSWIISVRLNRSSRQFLYSLWEYLAFLTNSLIFLLVGLASARALKQIDSLGTWALALGVAIAAILLSRAVVVFGLLPIVNRTRSAPNVGRAEQIVIFWGGLRGAVGLALALSLENEVENGQFLVALTLGIVLFTLLIPGTTMPKLLELLGLNESSMVDKIGNAEALITAHEGALSALKDLSVEDNQHPKEIKQATAQAEQQLAAAQQQLETIFSKAAETAEATSSDELQKALWLQALAIEQQSYRQMHDSGVLSASAFVQVNRSLSARQIDIFANKIPSNQLRMRATIARTEAMITHFSTRVLSRLLRRNSLGEKLRQRSNLKHFVVSYECDLAIAYASKCIIERLHSLSQYDRTDKTIFSACLERYRTELQAAKERLAQSTEQNATIARQSGQQIIQRVAVRGRKQAIATLLEDGVISTAVSEAARQHLSKERPKERPKQS